MAEPMEDLRRLEESLSSPNENTRYATIRTVANRSGRPLVGLLLRALADESWRVRKEAVEALAGQADREPVTAALVEIVAGGPDERTRCAAAEVLLLLGKGVYSALTRLLASGHPEARRRAAVLLGDLAEAAAVPSLAAAIVDSDRRVRIAAAEALGALASDGAAQALTVAVESVTDVGTRLACLDSLARLGQAPPFSVLAESVRHVAMRRISLRLLAHSDQPEAVPLVVEALSDPRAADREAALIALEALRRHGLSAEEFERARDNLFREEFRLLREALRSFDPEVRRAASALAGWLGVASLALELAHAARQPVGGDSALEALETMGESAVEALLHSGAAPSDRAAALEALGRLSAMAALPLCREALDDPHPIVAAAAARALLQLGDAQDLPALLRAMERGARPLLAAAGEALRTLGEREPEELAALVSGWSFEGRDDVGSALLEASSALGEHANPELLRSALSNGGPRTRRAAARAAAEVGAIALAPDLARLVEDERADVRTAALEALAALAGLGGSEALAALGPALERGLVDPEADVRVAAVAAVLALGAERASHQLPDLATSPDPTVARAGVAAIRALGPKARLADRLAALEAAVLHEDAAVVHGAVAALGEVDDPAAVAPLVTALAHQRFEIRIAAANALKGRGEPVRGILRERLTAEDDPLVRETLRRALRLLP